ncbi:Arylsulfatase [hydrothermal vent metagenome]|uniref:Arylsulfatase n=1 Tax=hydrothermal vent metagenome TaxID=652676 RepID=A0A3B1CFR8_9ZZZZ
MKYILKILLVLLLFSITLNAQNAKPNIIVIVSDDAGYSDFGSYGSKVLKTPNIDKLADSGVRFTNGYVSASVCGPSRAGLMTGRYQQRFGYEVNNVPKAMDPTVGLQGEDMGLPLDQMTMADYMKRAGYVNMAVGKWHLGIADCYHPLERGFDEFYGFLGGSRHYFQDDRDYIRKDNAVRRNHVKQADFDYTTDGFTNAAVDFIDRHKKEKFFVYLAYNAVHTPLQAKEQDMEDYGFLKDEKYQTYAGMMKSLDENIGKLLTYLDDENLRENTLIFFINDNGGPTYVTPANNDPLSGCKGTNYEGGIRVPFIISWTSVLPKNEVYDSPVISFDILATMLDVVNIKAREKTQLDGVNLLPYLLGNKKERPHKTLFWRENITAAVRDGDWKLIRFPDKPAELYNLSQDISEVNDLAAREPEKVKELYGKLWNWEHELARPLWFLQTKFDKQVIDKGIKYHKVKK